MSPPRFRLRSLMILVAVLAVIAGLGVRAARLRERARFHRQREIWSSILAELTGFCGTAVDFESLVNVELTRQGASIRPVSAAAEAVLKNRDRQTRERKAAFRVLADYHSRCARRAEHAVLRPWLSVPFETGPPEPK